MPNVASGAFRASLVPLCILLLAAVSQALSYYIQIISANLLPKTDFVAWSSLNAQINIMVFPTNVIPLLFAKRVSAGDDFDSHLFRFSVSCGCMASLIFLAFSLIPSSGSHYSIPVVTLSCFAGFLYYIYSYYAGRLVYESRFLTLGFIGFSYCIFRIFSLHATHSIIPLSIEITSYLLVIANIGLVLACDVVCRSLGDTAFVSKIYSLFRKSGGFFKRMNWRDLFETLGYWLIITVFLQIDVIVAQHYFDTDTAAGYAKASMIAKIIYFAPSVLVQYLTKRMAAARLNQEHLTSRRILLNVGLTCFLVGALALALMSFRDSMFQIIFHATDSHALQSFPWAVFLTSVLAICTTVFTCQNAVGRSGFILVAMIGLILAGVALLLLPMASIRDAILTLMGALLLPLGTSLFHLIKSAYDNGVK